MVFVGRFNFLILLLLYHAWIFIIPAAIWSERKEKKIPKTFKKLSTSGFTEDWTNQRNQLIEYITSNPKSRHQSLAKTYIACEFLTVILIIINMLYTCLFIDDFWNEYRQAASSFLFLDFSQFYRESSVLFPRQVTCSYSVYNFEPFKIMTEEVVCSFPQNDVTAIIFAFLYIWYIFILTWAVLHLIIMIAMYSFKCLRLSQIRRMLGRPATTCECKHLSDNGNIGLWFTLRIFRRNMLLAQFQDLCTGLLAAANSSSNP
jgi:hypothetical protein